MSDIDNLKTCVDMNVWDNEDTTVYKRTIVFIDELVGCMDDNGTWWDHYSEIKEPEYVPFESEDNINHLLGKTFRETSDKSVKGIITGIDPDNSTEMFFMVTGWKDPLSAVLDFEVYIDGEWKPIGKLKE